MIKLQTFSGVMAIQRLGGRIHYACADLAGPPGASKACDSVVSTAMPSLLYSLRGMFRAKVDPYDLHGLCQRGWI